MSKIVVTGASGVLGSAVYNAFRNSGCHVTGLAHSRPTSELRQLDLLDEDSVANLAIELHLGRGDWIVHCAAERRPDVAQKNPEGTEKLNVNVPAHLSKLAAQYGFTLIYISTDYVFDGMSPPYSPESETNPLQLYGRTKRDGENAVLAVEGAKAIVLRVPILYGPMPNNGDSAVNILLDIVKDQSGKQYKMDHYATRYPTNILDIAGFLVRLTSLPKDIPPIVHYSAGEPFTKYEMCLILAKILELPTDHILPDADPPQGGTPRPANTQLDVRQTEALFEGSGFEGLGWSVFEEWWTGYLGKSAGSS